MEYNENSQKTKPQKPKKQEKHNPQFQYLNYIIIEIYNLSIKKQILIFSFLLYTLFILAIIFLKYQKMNINKTEISDNLYRAVVGKDYFHDLTETYKNIHSLSFDRNMTHFTKGVNFLSVFSRELNRIKANPVNEKNKENFIAENSLKNLNYENLNVNNDRLNFKIDENEKKKFFKENKKNGNFLLFPIYYTMIPNLIDDAKFNDLKLEKIYFVDSAFSKGECEEDTNYFTFPKYKENLNNFYLFDEKADPHSKCEKDYNIIQNNFFVNYEVEFSKEKKFSSKIFNQIQMKEDDMKYTNLFSIIMSNNFKDFNNDNNKNSILSIGFNFIDDFSLKKNNQNNKINHFSIAYYDANLLKNYDNTMESVKNKTIEELPRYDIVNGKRQVLTIPPFMENLYIHGYEANKYFKEYKDDLHAIVSTKEIFSIRDNSAMLNLGFEKDSKNFNLLAFLFKQTITFPENLCADNDYELTDFGVLDESDCFKGLCFFNECVGTENIFNATIFQEGFVECKCLPLFCGNYTQKRIKQTNDTYFKYKEEKINNQLKNSTSFDNTDEVKKIINEYSNFQKLEKALKYLNGDYFKYLKKNNKTLQCKLNYEKKRSIGCNDENLDVKRADSVFLVDISLSKMPFFSEGRFVVSYLINLNEFIYELYLHYAEEIEYYNSFLLFIYCFLIWLSSVIFFYRFVEKIDKFKERIDRLTEDKILQKILERNNEIELSGEFAKENFIGEENRIFSIKQNHNEPNPESYLEADELNEVEDILYQNINIFLISFNYDIIFHEEDEIFVKYIDILKSEIMKKTEFDREGYTKKIINFYFGKNFIDYFVIENLRDEKNKQKYLENFDEKKELIKKYDENKKMIFKDYSALLLMEFISTEIDLDLICNNFYYKDVLNKNSNNTFEVLISKLKDDIPPVCESCDYEKMRKFITFIKENVIFKWHVEEQKNIFNEYYYSQEY